MSTNSSICDTAYFLAKKAYTASDHANAKELLEKQYPRHSWDEILDAYLKGCYLAEHCYEIGEKARLEKISDNEALYIIENRFPGFNKETYKDALTFGWFLSR